MKKFLLPVLIFLVFSLGSSAQIIQIEDMTPQIGDVYIQASSDYVSPGAAGANQTWDLSELVANETFTTNVAHPAGLPGAENFPTASFAMVNEDDMEVGYSALLANRIEIVGMHEIDALTTYSNPRTQLEFPLSFQATYSDTYERFSDYDGFEEAEIGEVSVVVDGYGTLITPTGTFTDVLRLKQEIESEIIVTTEGEDDDTYNYISTTYFYVKAGYRVPLACLSVCGVTGITANTAKFYIDSSIVGLDELSPVSNLTIFPVPVTSDFTVNMDLEIASEVSFNLFSVDGRKVAQFGKGSFPAGANTQSLSLPENTASGIYLLQIQTPESILTKKIVVQ